MQQPSRGPFRQEAALRSAEARGETLDQLLDRNVGELLQELRVAITGVQILFAFLLGLAFTQRFEDLAGRQLAVYTVTLLTTALATVLLIAPVSFHRLVFRRRQKAALVAVGDLLLRIGLGLLVLAISSAVLLILDIVFGPAAGIAGGCLVLLTGGLTWYVLPLWARRAGHGRFPDHPGDTDRDTPPNRGGSAMTERPEHAPDVDQPEGGGPSREQEGTGRTPRPDQPAEGEDVGGEGADTPDEARGR